MADDNEVSCHKYLEQGKHDKMLHPDANVDDGVEPAEGWTEVPLAWERNLRLKKNIPLSLWGDDGRCGGTSDILASNRDYKASPHTFECCSKGHGKYEHCTDGVDDAEVLDQKEADDPLLDLAVVDVEHDADVGGHGDGEDEQDEWALEGLQQDDDEGEDDDHGDSGDDEH